MSPTNLRTLGLSRSSWSRVLIVLLIVAYLTPRLSELDRVMTVDESFWLGRSANFYEGLAHGNFEDTYQHAHPGVTIMWAGTLGFLFTYPEYPADHPAQIKKPYAVHEDLQALGESAADLLMAGRIFKILIEGVLFAVGIWLARGVFGQLIGSVSALLIAFDPFLIGHDRLLHIDGMCAMASWVSLMALFRYLDSQDRRFFLVLSGAVAALAWLTRTPAVLLVPVSMLALFGFVVYRWRRNETSYWSAARDLVVTSGIWLTSAVVTTFVVWPVLWTAPGMAARRMYDYSRDAVAAGHEAGIFFNGQTYRGDPGLLYYPVSLLYRLTPVSLAGIMIVVIALALRSSIILPHRVRGPLVLLGLFALLYVASSSLGAKKFDRYILPVYPGLDVIAAVGIVGIGKLLIQSRQRWRYGLARVVVMGALMGQLASGLSMAPYYLPYFNPLVGGTAGGEKMLLLGWGEGMDQAADYILSQPGGENAVVHTSNARVSLIYVLPPSVTVETHAYETDIASLSQWVEADYYVAYVSQWQRGYFSRPIDYLEQFQPVRTVSFGGTEFVRVYDLNAIPPPGEMIDDLPCSFAFGDQIQLLGYLDKKRDSPDGTNLHEISIYFLTGAKYQDAYEVRVDFLPRTSAPDSISRTVTLQPAAQVGMPSQIDIELVFPGKRTVKSYMVMVTLIDPATGDAIPATHTQTGVVDDQALMTECR